MDIAAHRASTRLTRVVQRLVETHADMLPEELSDPERSNVNRH
jgi:hypothetical protein